MRPLLFAFVLCARLIAQAENEAEVERLLAKIKEARARAGQPGVSSAVDSRLSSLVFADPISARSRGMNMIQNAPSRDQSLAWLALIQAQLRGDDAAAAADAQGAALVRRLAAPAQRNPALQAQLEQFKDIETVKQLREALVLGPDARRITLLPVCAAVGRGEPAVVAALIRLLSHADPELRWRAALGLCWSAGTAAAREAVPALVERLQDSDFIVRVFVIGALWKIAPDTKELVAAVNALPASQDGITQQVASWIERDRSMRDRQRVAAQKPRTPVRQAVPVTTPAPRNVTSRPTTRKGKGVIT